MYGKPLRPPGILVRYGAEGRLFSDILKSGIKRRKRLKKLYLDYHIYDRYRKQSDSDEDVTLELEGREYRLVKAGTQILVLKGDPRDPYYKEIAGKSGMHFIFEGNVPEVPFYAVPYLCIIGRDEKGGFFAMKNRPDPEEWFFDEAEPVYYIPGWKRVFFAAGSLLDLLEEGSAWRGSLRESRKIRLYPSRQAAEKSRPFAGEAMLPYYEEKPWDMDIPLPFD